MWGSVLLPWNWAERTCVISTEDKVILYFFSHKSMMVTHREATKQQIPNFFCTDAQSSSPHIQVQQFYVKIKDHSTWANSASQLFGLYWGTEEMRAVIHRSTGKQCTLKLCRRGSFWPFSVSSNNGHGQILQLLKTSLFCKNQTHMYKISDIILMMVIHWHLPNICGPQIFSLKKTGEKKGTCHLTKCTEHPGLCPQRQSAKQQKAGD